jgi:Cof subfamily protein (haloacid dehalogenase superfamily)
MPINLNPENLKALALDLDGTVLRPGAVLSERTIRALRSCQERGVQIIIATGRAIEAVEKFRLPLGAEGPMVYFNGAIVASMPGTKILHTCLLEPGAVDYCIDLSRELGVYYHVFFPGTAEHPGQILVAEKEGSERDMYYNHTGLLSEIGDLKTFLKGPGVKGAVKSMFLAEPEVQDTIRPRLEERFGGSIYIARTYRNFLEIMNPRVSKGQGLRIALEHRGLTSQEVLAFGDEENDLPMFETAGFSAAPANAKDTVKAAADFIVASNAEDGVAAFLEELFSLPGI